MMTFYDRKGTKSSTLSECIRLVESRCCAHDKCSYNGGCLINLMGVYHGLKSLVDRSICLVGALGRVLRLDEAESIVVGSDHADEALMLGFW